jgi:phosphate transport system permease protein
MSELDLTASVPEEARMPRLQRQLFERRAMKNGILTALTWAVVVLGSIPLFSVIYMLVIQGGARLNLEALTA